MRVALITDGIWPYVLGGMQKHSYYLCKYLAQNKIDVDLYHFNKSNYDISRLEFFSEEELQFIHATVLDFPQSPPFPGHYIYDSYRYSKLIFQSVRNKLSIYDFIYTKGFSGWCLIDQKHSGKIKCGPIGVKFHGYEMFQKPPDLKIKLQHIFLLRKPVRSLSMKADYVFSYGGKITNIIRSLGVAEDKIFELPSGVEQSAMAAAIVPSRGTRKFLFLGRYERRKGIEELNGAITQILNEGKHTNTEFQFIGPIPVAKQLKHQRVVYHGEIRGREGLQELMRKCDVLICPSWSEGMPNVILEAMANGLAVIATDVGATSILVSDKTGWLLASGTPTEISSAVVSATTLSADALDQKKQNAISLIGLDFTWEELGKKLTAFIKKAVSN
jgi:glycosyltransferase involved in cell wall biosynthesis